MKKPKLQIITCFYLSKYIFCQQLNHHQWDLKALNDLKVAEYLQHNYSLQKSDTTSPPLNWGQHLCDWSFWTLRGLLIIL